MENSDNKICSDFKNEVWLFLDQDLAPGKMEYWNRHIKDCNTCSALISSISHATAFAKKDLQVELPDPAFNKMIGKVFSKENRSIFSLNTTQKKHGLLTASRLKYSFAAGLIILAFIFSFNITKNNPLRTFNKNVQTEIQPAEATLSQMVEMVYGNELDKQIELLENQVNGLNTK